MLRRIVKVEVEYAVKAETDAGMAEVMGTLNEVPIEITAYGKNGAYSAKRLSARVVEVPRD